ENARVLKWIVERLEEKAPAQKSAIGYLPTKASLDVEGLNISDEHLDLLLSVDRTVWKEEASLIPPAYEKFCARLRKELWEEHAALVERLEGVRPTETRRPAAAGEPAAAPAAVSARAEA